MQGQNHRQKVVNRRALRLCEGDLRSCRGGLTFNLTKIPLIYSVSYFNVGGNGTLFGGANPTKASPWQRDCARPLLHKYSRSSTSPWYSLIHKSCCVNGVTSLSICVFWAASNTKRAKRSTASRIGCHARDRIPRSGFMQRCLFDKMRRSPPWPVHKWRAHFAPVTYLGRRMGTAHGASTPEDLKAICKP